MLDLKEYKCLGEALRAALDRWPDEVCLIEADRDREKARLAYRQFKEAALPLARALQDAGFQSGTRAAIIMTNQSKCCLLYTSLGAENHVPRYSREYRPESEGPDLRIGAARGRHRCV